MPLLERFLDPTSTSLKICGVTREADAIAIAELGVDAIGVNFWPRSKRHLNPDQATWLASLAPHILRVGVFVNQEPELPMRLYDKGFIDAVQLHGDERPQDAAAYIAAGIPFIKAIGVQSLADLDQADAYGARAILLDAHAPGIYGGTGAVFDWNTAIAFKASHPQLPILLAGGITADNARLAVERVQPAALDVASGAESSPGIKDLNRVKALLAAVRS